MVTRALAVGIASLACLVATAGSALAHAVLEDTQPARGATLERPPERVTLRFDEAVEAAFGAVRVYDASGERVDAGEVERPSAESVAIGLRDGLRDGPYTATYRIVSADSHPVSGGFVFMVGEAGGAAPVAVGDVVGAEAGPVTATAFAIDRAVAYAATAVVVGGLVFLLVVGGARPPAFQRRMRVLIGGAAAAGVVATAVGFALQGATAAGTSVWTALELDVLRDVLETRFGAAWAVRLLAFATVAVLVLAVRFRNARPIAMATALPSLALVVAPALAGHARAADDAALLVPLDALHVAAASVWVGGVVACVLALPTATRVLAPPDRTALLATVVARFSPLAIAAVVVLVATGTVQAIAQLDALSDVYETAFGRAILVKVALLAALVALGAHNRLRSRRRLARAAADGAPPGAAGRALKRVLVAETALMAAVLIASGALVGYSPSSAREGPVAVTQDAGPVRVELTVDPAEAGRNEMHVYLFDRRTGAPFARLRGLALKATETERGIGPLRLPASRAGPGHYVVPKAQLSPPGDWEIELRGRLSAFEELRAAVEVPIR